MPHGPYEQLLDHLRETSLLGSTAGLLNWDQQVMMPRRGVEHRSRQVAQLAALIHERVTDPRVEQWLVACEGDEDLMSDPAAVAAVNVRQTRRRRDRVVRLPATLVEAFASTGSLARAAWAEARATNDFERFRPWLERLVDLCRQKAACFGWQGHPWDALAEDFEPGVAAARLDAVFAPLRDRLGQLRDRLAGGTPPPNVWLNRKLPRSDMERFVRFVADRLGFDFESGRLDVSAHPFCSGLAPHDVRMTTRFDEPDPVEPLFSTIHETGHGLYNLGLDAEHVGTPMGSAVSHGIHESQSRLWENLVGRSESFWRWCLPQMQRLCGAHVADLTLASVVGAVNRVQPGLIRVEADEVHYNLHIMVRFDLEKALMAQELAVADLPDAWNQAYRDTVGIEVPDDARGCMQDIHWSQGAIGYFPSYALGNLHAAQIYEAARSDLPDLDDHLAAGRFEPLLVWLRESIHRHGMRYEADQLCRRVTGRSLDADALLRNLESRLAPIYGL